MNKPSSVESKEKILRVHIVPRIGDLRLDQVTYSVIEDLKVALAKASINADKTYREAKIETTSKRRLSAKTINNCLTVLRRMLVVARKRGHIASVPDFEWMKSVRPEFDFLDFEEAERLVNADDRCRAAHRNAARRAHRAAVGRRRSGRRSDHRAAELRERRHRDAEVRQAARDPAR
jgi:hypothetical protein